jgi:hypothetical protein
MLRHERFAELLRQGFSLKFAGIADEKWSTGLLQISEWIISALVQQCYRGTYPEGAENYQA